MSGASLQDVIARYQFDEDTVREVVGLVMEDELPFSRLNEVTGVTGLAAELAKKNIERKTMHEWLTAAGVPEYSAGSEEGICLLGRLAWLIGRL